MRIFNVGNSSVNRYLLDSGTHRLLIDTGFPGQLNDLGREMRQTGYIIRDIDFLLVTHFHVDHAGAVQEIKEQGVQFILIDLQQPFIEPMERMIAGKWHAYKPLHGNDNIILSTQDASTFLRQMGIDGVILPTPGHTDDSVSLVLHTGEAFTGDLTAEHLVMDTDAVTQNSWAALRRQGVQIIYPGHGSHYKIG